MGRRSLAAVRRAHIIAVTIDCIATHGFGGTTLERIADTAGMARGHIRHYAGNRDELLTDAARVFYFGPSVIDVKDTAVAAAQAPLIGRDWTLDQAVDYLLGEFAEPNAENAAAFAFMDASRSMPSIHEIVLSAYAGMQESLTVILQHTYPDAGNARCRRAAYALVAMAIGHLWFIDLEETEERIADARADVDAIISMLEDDRASAPDARTRVR